MRPIKSYPITLTVKPHPSGASLLRSITHFDASTDGHTLVNMPSKGDQISPGRPTVKPHPSTRRPETTNSLSLSLFHCSSPAVIRQWMTIPRQTNTRVKLIKFHPATPSRQTSSTVVPVTVSTPEKSTHLSPTYWHSLA